MAEITAALVKELREKTGAGMMDCKKALGETAGNLEEAIDWLRTKGLAAAAKKAGRTASEGLVGVHVDGNGGAVVEINAETDFVARNDTFQAFVATTAELALANNGDEAAIKAAAFPGESRNVEEQLTHLIATIGENMSFRRAAALSVGEGVVTAYVHNQLAPGLGKIGVLVGLESTGDKDALAVLGKQIAMHIAAAAPMSVSRDDLDPAVVERERSVLIEQAKESGKPAEIAEKMVEGRIRKYFEEVCLLDQTFAIDGETKVSQVLENAGKDAGAPIRVAGFVAFRLGEGIEKEESDFAAEVAAAVGG
ncbi:MAG: translation elongation factor Ts [Rhodospirillales bacterium]